jgi:hypothetical protein
MSSGLRRQVGRGIADRLQARLLVVGDDRDVAGSGLARAQNRDLAMDTEHFGHFCLERRVTSFEIVAHLVWLDLVAGKDLADRALNDGGHTRMSGGHGGPTRMARQ